MPVNITYLADLVDGPWMKEDPKRALAALNELVRDSRTPRDELWIVNGLGRILPPELMVRAQDFGHIGADQGTFEDFCATEAAGYAVTPTVIVPAAPPTEAEHATDEARIEDLLDGLESPPIPAPQAPREVPSAPLIHTDPLEVPLSVAETPPAEVAGSVTPPSEGQVPPYVAPPAAQEVLTPSSAEILVAARDAQRELKEDLLKERLRQAQADRAQTPKKSLFAAYIQRVEAAYPITRETAQPATPTGSDQTAPTVILPSGTAARREERMGESIEEFRAAQLTRVQEDATTYSTDLYRALEARLSMINLVNFPHALVPGGSDVIPTCKKHLGGHTLLHYTATTETLAIQGIRVYGQGAEIADVPELTRILDAEQQESGYTLTDTQPDIIVVSQIPTIADTRTRRSLEMFLQNNRGKVVFVRNPKATFSARVQNGNLILEGTSFAMDPSYEHPGSFIVAQYEPPRGEVYDGWTSMAQKRPASFRAYVMQVVPRFSADTGRLEEFMLRECYRVQWNGGDEVEVRKDRDFRPKEVFDAFLQQSKK